ncbi:MAG: ABC transporter substrate-binding protein [Xenococcaceae cyanobacterium]
MILGFYPLFNLATGTQTETVTLNVLMSSPGSTHMQSLVRVFEEKNPGIKINIIEGPNSTNLIEDLYTSAFILGDSPYDLLYMDIIWVPKFAAAGWLMDMSDRISKEELGKFLSGDLNGGRYQGGLYRLPFMSAIGILYYRKDLLKQAGYDPPTTFEQLEEISQALQSQKAAKWGYVWQGKQYEGLSAMFVEILEGFGGFWVNPETKEVGLDREPTLKAIEFLRSLIDKGISPPGVTTYQELETLRFFLNGETVFLRNWPYVWGEVNKEGSELNGKIAISPMVHAPGYRSGACQGGWGWGIAKTTKHPEEAWKAVEFFTSEEGQKQYILENSYIPSRHALYTDPEVIAKYSHYPELLKVLDTAVLRPPISQYSQASDILQRYLSAALTNHMSPEKAMKAAADETRLLLGTS